MIILVIWLGLMGLAGMGAVWLLVSRFPEVFFETQNWKATRKGRVVRIVILVGSVLSGLTLLAGIAMLVFMRTVPLD